MTHLIITSLPKFCKKNFIGIKLPQKILLLITRNTFVKTSVSSSPNNPKLRSRGNWLTSHTVLSKHFHPFNPKLFAGFSVRAVLGLDFLKDRWKFSLRQKIYVLGGQGRFALGCSSVPPNIYVTAITANLPARVKTPSNFLKIFYWVQTYAITN